jgi:uncharacterized protein (DUF433 family)
MVSSPIQAISIIRTERGLTIAGTRMSLYEIIDLLKANYPSKLIRDVFNLTNAQIDAALAYIATNQSQVEAEYQEVLHTREEIRQYWEDRNRDRLAAINAKPHKPEHQAIWDKLEQQKAKRQAAQSQ